MPKLAVKCIESWKKYCSGYEIICWNEDNFDISSNRYAKEAYDAGKWAFVSDYVRLKDLYDHGGIYFDTDVELIKPLDPLLAECGYMGFERDGLVSTGLGFACEKGNAIVGHMLSDYNDIAFVKPDGSFDFTPCPDRNTAKLKMLGMDITKRNQIFMDMQFFSEEYFCPMDYYTGRKKITPNTYSIHHYTASWTSAKSRRTTLIKRIIGVKLYEKLYGKFLHRFKWLEW